MKLKSMRKEVLQNPGRFDKQYKFKHQPLLYPILRTARLASVESAKFGMVRNGGTRAHQGIDLAVPVNYRVYAVEDGEVLMVRNEGSHGMQIAIRMSTNNDLNGLIAFYSHLNRMDVKVGDKVKAGQVIGLTGSTGNAVNMTTVKTGSHLHFEIRTTLWAGLGLQNRIDPLPYVSLTDKAPFL